MEYQEALSIIHTATRLGSQLGLERIRRLCDLLGRPQDSLHFVHVAGTNGKGSTVAMTANTLQRAGYKTGMFISPFVLDFRERMQINGEMIPPQELADTLECMLPLIAQMKQEGAEPTEFEIVTALALRWFADRGCDIVVFEVGLGGRFDSTNVIDAPDCAAILSISLDHTHILGNTTAEIAFEKCGILKEGSRAAVYPLLDDEALAVVKRICAEKGISPNIPDLSQLTVLQSGFDGSHIRYRGEEYHISMRGEYQIYNALTVLSICEELRTRGWSIPQDAVQRGLANTHFGGRLEVVRRSPLCMIDGAHNPDAVAQLCRAMDEFFAGRRVVTVMGMVSDKDYRHCIGEVASRSDVFIAAQPDSPRALSAAEAAAAASQMCSDVRVQPDPMQAARDAVAAAGADDVVIACGSLYMIGDCKRAFQETADAVR